MRLLTVVLAAASVWAADWQLVSVKRIWDQPKHAAFGDLIRWNGRWFAVFREGQGHAPSKGKPDDGTLRVLASTDGDTWTSQAVLTDKGVDLRDPHLAISPRGELCIVAGGSYYPNGEYTTRHSRTFFSKDGKNWSAPNPVMEDGHWLWRVTAHGGKLWGVSKYGVPANKFTAESRKIRLVHSANGRSFSTVTELAVPGGDETALRFLNDGRMIALSRRTWDDGNLAWIGTSAPPYKEWKWSSSGYFIGGPNLLPLPNGVIAAGGRNYENGDRAKPFTSIGEIASGKFVPRLRLPSGGDSSYPGFVWHDGLLWVLYYSSHEGKTSIYLAKVRI